MCVLKPNQREILIWWTLSIINKYWNSKHKVYGTCKAAFCCAAMCCCSAWSLNSLFTAGLESGMLGKHIILYVMTLCYEYKKKIYFKVMFLKQYLAPGLFIDWLWIRRLFSLSSSARIATLFLFWNPIENKCTNKIVNLKQEKKNSIILYNTKQYNLI